MPASCAAILLSAAVLPAAAAATPDGYPQRMDDELGMRLWWAGLEGR
jgi:hypothetical protein